MNETENELRDTKIELYNTMKQVVDTRNECSFYEEQLEEMRMQNLRSHNENPPHRGCAGGRIGTRFLRPRGTSPLKGVNPTGTPGYINGTESFFGLKGRPSVVRDV